MVITEPPAQPSLVASQTSGVDGSSEGGRISTGRLPSTLVLYGVPLLDEIRRGGFRGKLLAQPARVDGTWVLKVIHDGDAPAGVPDLWHGHRVVLEAAPAAAPAAPAAPASAPAPATAPATAASSRPRRGPKQGRSA